MLINHRRVRWVSLSIIETLRIINLPLSRRSLILHQGPLIFDITATHCLCLRHVPVILSLVNVGLGDVSHVPG